MIFINKKNIYINQIIFIVCGIYKMKLYLLIIKLNTYSKFINKELPLTLLQYTQFVQESINWYWGMTLQFRCLDNRAALFNWINYFLLL